MTKYDFTSLDKIQQIIKDCTKKPENYLSVQDRISENLKNSTKNLYDIAFKTKSSKHSKSQALPELIVNDFDAEQIWQQLELENNEEFSRLNIGNISKTLASNKSWVLPLKLNKNDDSKESIHSEEEDDEDGDDQMSVESDDILSNKNNEITTKKVASKVKKRKRTTEVDDKFFKLDELDEFLKIEDKKALKGEKEKNNSSDEDDGSIDLFNDFSDSDDDDEDQDDNNDEIKNGRTLKYADFFDNPESDNEVESENIHENQGNSEFDENNMNDEDEFDEDNMDDKNDITDKIHQKFNKEKIQVKFNLLNDSDGLGSDEDVNMEDDKEDNNKSKVTQSTLEARQERLKKRIEQLEEEAISEKPWQLKGESSAQTRPQNSLLEEFVEFDTVTRPAPIMTEQTTMKLEDIIIKRIKDKVWDDVEKKFKPVETPMEYKKKLIMNQEKSKESLAQIYENEYIKQREALNGDDKDEQEKEEPPEHIEIREKMHSLFRKLDALSNFHYTPKQAKPEIKIVSNVPAINMEEVAPVATSDATLLAPEEVQAKPKGDVIGKSERTKTDMKRERRKKKLKQHARAVHQNNKSTDNVKQKKSLKNPVKKLKGRNIINTDQETNNDGKAIKSSTAFFAQLQDEVKSGIKAKTKTTSKKDKNTISAVKLKL